MAKTVKASKPSTIKNYKPSTYSSDYTKKLNRALNTVTNWSYDPLQDASYQALAKVYGQRGNIAAKNTLADAAALNGGYGTSYAVSAAQQARNQYNQELASYIPDLENQAYTRATGTLSALRDADDTAYGRFRDTETDRQWKYSMQYDKYRDRMADYQWAKDYNYQLGRDKVADRQWAKDYNYQLGRDKVADRQWALEFALAQDKAGGSGGGRSSGGGRRRSYSSGYSSGGTKDTGSGILPTEEEYKDLGLPVQGPQPNAPITIKTIGDNAARRALEKKKK